MLLPKNTIEVNLYIDLSQLLYPLYKFDSIADPLGVLATMINLPLHYRNYFNKYYIKSNIFLIYTANNSLINLNYLPDYNAKKNAQIQNNINIQNIMSQNIQLLSTICPYLPGIYLKQGTVESILIAYDLISKFNNKGYLVPSFFITASDISYILPSVCKNISVLYKKQIQTEDHKSQDISFAITPINIISSYIRNTKNKIMDENDNMINQDWIIPFFILNGLQCRSLKSLLSYTQTIKALKYIQMNYGVYNPDNIYEAYYNVINNKMVDINKQEIYNRYYCLDLNFQLQLYRELPESLESSFLVDINDPQTLYDTINQFFRGSNIINLNNL